MASVYGLDLDATQADILAHLKSVMPAYQIESGGIPDADSIIYTDGVLKPYIVMAFADLMPTGGDYSYGGAKFDGYYSYVNIYSVAPTDVISRQVVGQARNRLLGYVPVNASELKPAPGGGTFSLSQGRDLPTAYTSLSTLRFNTNVDNVGTTRFD